ncbi:MAG: dehydrogenase, partial [Pseudonocardiales bacterium]|nr:dehydrogenase [Pseudonocardiales bacterium]
MHAAVFHGPGNVRVENVAEPTIDFDSDAIVQVTAAGLCGSDLWPFRGYGGEIGMRVGHEFVGTVVSVGSDVRTVRVGDTVIAPPRWSDGTCEFCLAGLPSSCVDGGAWGEPSHDGGLGERVRVPQADGTLIVVPRELNDDLGLLLALSCAMPAAHHAAVSAGVQWGSTAVIVGDGAVGLCGVLAARRLGAEHVVVVGHHDDRLAIASAFGATDVIRADVDSGLRAVEEVISRTGGAGSVLECAGVQSSWSTAVAVARDGARIGYIGHPHPVDRVDLARLFERNITLAGGLAPARAYLPELLRAAAAGELNPSA